MPIMVLRVGRRFLPHLFITLRSVLLVVVAASSALHKIGHCFETSDATFSHLKLVNVDISACAAKLECSCLHNEITSFRTASLTQYLNELCADLFLDVNTRKAEP